jgi:translation initiation factor IF-1
MKKRPDESGLQLAIPNETGYGIVHRGLGDRRFAVELTLSGSSIACRLAGRIPKGRENRIVPGDYVLVEIRTYESTSTVYQPGGTIILKYTPVEIRKLQKMGELTERSSSQFDTSSVCFVETAKAVVHHDTYDWDLPFSDESSESEEDD